MNRPNHIVVRRAEKEDVRQIAEILVEDWQKAYRSIMDSDFLDSMSADQRYEMEIKRYQKYIVAADGDEILGYAWPEITEYELADCEIIALYVRYSKRNIADLHPQPQSARLYTVETACFG